MIWRRLLVYGKTSLADLHHIIQIAMGWDDEYLHNFRIHGEDYGLSYEDGMSFSHDARQVFVDDFGFDTGDRFNYTFNFIAHWLCDIRIERIESSTQQAPRCYGGSGRLGEDEARYYKVDEFMALIDILDKVAATEQTIADDDFHNAIDHFRSVQFSRTVINKQLKATFHS